MTEQLKNEAKIKFEKMLEMAADIDKNGTTSGDTQMHQLVIAGVLASKNEYLNELMESAMQEDFHPEILHTIIMGIFLAQNNYTGALNYVNKVLSDKDFIDESLESKEALLLAADCLVNALNEGNLDCKATFIKLFDAACRENSTALLADKLLQRFLTILPESSSHVNDTLIEMIDKNEFELNSRLVAIDILARAKAKGFPEVLESLIYDIENQSYKNSEKMYMLDVMTKSLNLLASGGVKFNYPKVLSFLNSLDFSAKDEDELSQIIIKRVQKRLKNINDIFNSRN